MYIIKDKNVFFLLYPPHPTGQGICAWDIATLKLNIKLDNKTVNIHIQDVKFLHLCRYSNWEYLKIDKR